MFVNISQAMRADLVKQLTGAGCASDIAHEAVDLAAHAVDQAIEAVKTVCMSGSVPQVLMTSHPLALTMLSAAAEVHANATTVAARIAAERLGMKVVDVSVLKGGE